MTLTLAAGRWVVPSARQPGAGRRSTRLLVYLRSLPRWLPPTVLGLVLLAGLALPGLAGAVALLLVAAFLEWLLTLSWPVLSPAGKAIRVLALLLLLFAAVAKARG